MRNGVLKHIHEGHLGVAKCRLRAHTSVYWPGINKDINDMVGHYEMCQMCKPKNQREPLINVEIPSTAWIMLGIDLFVLEYEHYLVLGDYMLKFPIMRRITNQTSTVVIQLIKAIFSEFGNVKEIVSDNSPCFKSLEIEDFLRSFGIKHTSISPYHHQANGQIEQCIRMTKGILKRIVMTLGCLC